MKPPPRAGRRARDLGFAPGALRPGPHNAITDVAGVRVGHATIVADGEPGVRGRGPVRTGVTAVIPAEGDAYAERLRAGSFVLNGAGELAGLAQLREWGTLETPILLTDTMSVGAVSDALVAWVLESHAEVGRTTDVVIPVVGECDASWLSDVAARPVRAEHVRAALDDARSGPVAEGSIGAGTGMSTCDFAGGVGTASRVVHVAGRDYTLGVLVQSNFGARSELVMDGVPVGRLLEASEAPRRHTYGSIVVVVATDAPLASRELDRLATRAALGIARVGSYAAHGSGEIALAFSTKNRVPRTRAAGPVYLELLEGNDLNPLFQAAVEATEEAILNALCAGHERPGVDDHLCPALPLERIAQLVGSHKQAIHHAM